VLPHLKTKHFSKKWRNQKICGHVWIKVVEEIYMEIDVCCLILAPIYFIGYPPPLFFPTFLVSPVYL